MITSNKLITTKYNKEYAKFKLTNFLLIQILFNSLLETHHTSLFNKIKCI